MTCQTTLLESAFWLSLAAAEDQIARHYLTTRVDPELTQDEKIALDTRLAGSDDGSFLTASSPHPKPDEIVTAVRAAVQQEPGGPRFVARFPPTPPDRLLAECNLL